MVWGEKFEYPTFKYFAVIKRYSSLDIYRSWKLLVSRPRWL